MGNPDNVLPVVTRLKDKIEHSAEMNPDTQKAIQRVIRHQNPMFTGGGEPDRTLRILN